MPRSDPEAEKTYRDRMREQGLRPIRLWVPDTRSANFAMEARRQAQAVSQGNHAVEDQAFVDAISTKWP